MSASEVDLCTVCGLNESEHTALFAETEATLVVMKRISYMLSKTYAATLNQVVIDWRTHTLPTCDPLAID